MSTLAKLQKADGRLAELELKMSVGMMEQQPEGTLSSEMDTVHKEVWMFDVYLQ